MQAENEAGRRFQQAAKKKASIPTAQGRRLQEAPWYHPDLALDNVRYPRPFITPCDVGKTESITRVS